MAEAAQWRFPRFFWMANVAELFELGAYYGVFIGLVVYLTRNYGFSDVGAGLVFLNLLQGAARALLSPGTWSLFAVAYLMVAAAATLTGMWAARSGRKKFAAGLWRATGLATLPWGLSLFVSARLLRDGRR